MASSKRTRHRRQPKPAPPMVVDVAEMQIRELAVLWPRLEAALARDGAGPSASPSGGSGGGKHGSPAVIDLDTERVMTIIETDLRQLEAEVVALLGITPADRVLKRLRAEADIESARRRDAIAAASRVSQRTVARPPTVDEHVTRLEALMVAAYADVARRRLEFRAARVIYRSSVQGVLEQLPDWYLQLRARDQPLAEHLAKDARRWRRDAHQALRLRTVETPLGWTCPHHRAEPVELVRDRDEASLHEALVRGRAVPAGIAPLQWKYAETVHCPHCGQKWVGIEQMRVLMKMIDQVEEDERMRDAVLNVVREMGAEHNAHGEEHPLAYFELALLAAIGMTPLECTEGCGCRRATDDPDARDCACAAECTGYAPPADEADDEATAAAKTRQQHLAATWDELELALPEHVRRPASTAP